MKKKQLFDYVDVDKVIKNHQRKIEEAGKRRIEKLESKKIDILQKDKELLYDFDKEVVDNLSDGKDKYIILKISEKDNSFEWVADEYAKILTTPKSLLEKNVPFLKYFVMDYDTLFGIRYNQIKNYNNKIFDLPERVLFETLLIKFKRNNFEPFEWPKNKIEYELGIKRRVRERIFKRFLTIGILKKMERVEKYSKEREGPIKTTLFELDLKVIMNLLPTIYSNFSKEKMQEDISKYLKLKKVEK
ncbi:hypothetical protein [Zunongwangia sp. H14]|uniref:hypothetical protein n=1 Tax=Zunongwangia sp. H14 TaxID=3240792 RepID=UPI0035653608